MPRFVSLDARLVSFRLISLQLRNEILLLIALLNSRKAASCHIISYHIIVADDNVSLYNNIADTYCNPCGTHVVTVEYCDVKYFLIPLQLFVTGG